MLPLPAMIDKEAFLTRLYRWYSGHQRPLPWRQTRDAYRIWISEIILQQTRISQGTAYYERFVSTFPDVQSLASASPDSVLKVWEGLGYYSRARNLHRAAQVIIDRHEGKVPSVFPDLRKLPGVGPYTAAAIASIAYNMPQAAVDGNVLRFITRYAGIRDSIDTVTTIKRVNNIATSFLDENDPGTYNQAMMEFGALQCLKSSPKCTNCCFSDACEAYQRGVVTEIPSRSLRKPSVHRFFNYLFVLQSCGTVRFTYIRKRDTDDIWKGLYELPLIEHDALLDTVRVTEHESFLKWFGRQSPGTLKVAQPDRQVLSHQIIHAQFFMISLHPDSSPETEKYFEKVKIAQLSRVAFPRIITRFFEAIEY